METLTGSKIFGLKRGLALALSALLLVTLLAFNAIPSAPAQAAHRPFPDYDLSFEWIHGQVDPGWTQGDQGDGCIRSADNPVTELHHFAFSATVNPCDGVRTTMKFKYNTVDPDMAPTLDFRLGVTWQYTRRTDNDPFTWKPVENFMMDGEPVRAEKYDTSKQEAVVVKNSDGSWRHLGNNNPRDFFEPVHVVFDDEFHNDEEHTFQWDVYLPADADYAGMSIGTGSTGDTEGGSIGAKANGLYVNIPAKADYRYVLDSEYRASQKLPSIEELEKAEKAKQAEQTGQSEQAEQAEQSEPGEQTEQTEQSEQGEQDDQHIFDDQNAPEEDKYKLPNRRQAFWSGPLEGSTYTTIECLEDQLLAPVLEKQSIADMYSKLGEEVENPGEVLFQDGSGNFALARYPYEFYVGQPGNWASLSGLRLMNWDDASQKFLSYGDKNIPYKPTFKSVRREIPGYVYVDNDLPILSDGRMDADLVKSKAPNFKLSYHKTPGVDTQHMYFTYKKKPGTFELLKQAEDGTALAGAKFELYQLVNDEPSPCGVKPDLTNTEEISVCPVRTPSSPSELQEMLDTTPTDCKTERVRKVVLKGFNEDGSFTTGTDGTFKPEGDPALEPGKYFVRETSAPKDYKILNEYTPFEVPLQKEQDAKGNPIPVDVNVKNYKTPPPTTEPSTEPTTPPTPHLPKTGVAPLWPAALILFVAGAVLTVIRRKNAQ